MSWFMFSFYGVAISIHQQLICSLHASILGEWMLVDKCLGVALVNRFNVEEVYKCYIHWGTGTLNLELWSEDRPVSKQSPLTVSHEYEVIRLT